MLCFFMPYVSDNVSVPQLMSQTTIRYDVVFAPGDLFQHGRLWLPQYEFWLLVKV